MNKLFCLIGRKQTNAYIGVALLTTAFYVVRPSYEIYAGFITTLLVGTSALNVAEDNNKNRREKEDGTVQH